MHRHRPRRMGSDRQDHNVDRRSVLAAGAGTFAAMAAPAAASARQTVTFPDGFLWGAATSGHQTEGNNVNADQWLLETVEPRLPESHSGDACNSFALWEQDLDLVKAAGLNTYRFSVEWPRIEPVEGHFSGAMLDHYAAMIRECRARGITPLVTLCHFTTPRWFAAQGGWTNPASVGLFARYCERTFRHLGGDLRHITTFNEANVASLLRFVFPPQFTAALRVSLAAAARAEGTDRFAITNLVLPEDLPAVTANMIAAHSAAREAIKAIRADVKVGVTLAVVDDQASGPDSLRDSRRAASYGAWLPIAARDDYVGVQNYTRAVWNSQGKLPPPAGARLNHSGEEVYAPSLANAVRYVHSQTDVPILVTEHGVGTTDDTIRSGLIPEALVHLARAMDEGVPVGGYVHWSLLDNYEWGGSVHATYGLASVDPVTFRRTPKPSLAVLGTIARANRVTV